MLSICCGKTIWSTSTMPKKTERKHSMECFWVNCVLANWFVWPNREHNKKIEIVWYKSDFSSIHQVCRNSWNKLALSVISIIIAHIFFVIWTNIIRVSLKYCRHTKSFYEIFFAKCATCLVPGTCHEISAYFGNYHSTDIVDLTNGIKRKSIAAR